MTASTRRGSMESSRRRDCACAGSRGARRWLTEGEIQEVMGREVAARSGRRGGAGGAARALAARSAESGAGGRWRLRGVHLNRGREGRGLELGFGCGGERGGEGGGVRWDLS